MDPRDANFDQWLDAQLRAVPVPDDLLPRLQQIPDADGRSLSAALRAVPIPAGLIARLQAIPLDDDDDLDAALRAVPMPAGFTGRLRRIPSRNVPLRWAGLVLAASLLIAVGLSYLSVLVLSLSRSGTPPGLTAQLPESKRAVVETPRPAPEKLVHQTPSTQRPPEPVVVDPPPKIDVPLATFGSSKDKLATATGDFPESWRWALRQPAPGTVDPLLDAVRDAWPSGPVYGDKTFDEQLPELRKMQGLIPRGTPLPLARGVDLLFFVRTGIHPFLPPWADPKLETSAVPLRVDRSSFELTRRCLADGELPPPRAVRTEEFLAAMDYGLPRPKNEPLAVCLAAGPSPFAGEGLRLVHGGEALRMLHVAVQARDLVRAQRSPSHLVLAVDASARMTWGGRLELVGRALSALAGQLEPDDRLSLVTFSDAAQLVAEDIGPNDAGPFRAAVAALTAKGPANLPAGLHKAYHVAQHAEILPGQARRVVLVTDNLADLGRDDAALVEKRLAEAAAEGVRLEVIDVGGELEGSGPDRPLSRLAQAGGGRTHRASDVDQLQWALAEILTGREQLVARDVTLKVQFHPGSVFEYRLLGHEAAAVAGLMPERLETDFHAGQTGTALYEVLLKPKGSDDVATVEVAWTDPSDGQRKTRKRDVLRSQIVPDFLQTPLAFQQAVLAAEVAELLRDSPFARLGPNPGSLARVGEVLKRVDSSLNLRQPFADLTWIVHRAEKAKPYGRGTRKERGG